MVEEGVDEDNTWESSRLRERKELSTVALLSPASDIEQLRLKTRGRQLTSFPTRSGTKVMVGFPEMLSVGAVKLLRVHWQCLEACVPGEGSKEASPYHKSCGD